MAPRKKAEEAPVAAPKTRKRAAAPASAPMTADTTTSTPGNPTVCKTCNGHGATDIVPMNARNTESHYNKYKGASLRMGVGGGSHMGVACTACSAKGLSS
jgi:hypothetical protein